MKKTVLTMILLLFAVSAVYPQASWSRKKRTNSELQLFHSTYLINLPTAETQQKGNLEFEISHRFLPAVSEGGRALFGFDGPVNSRLALGYALTNRLLVTVGRSNASDNLDFSLKYKTIQIRNDFAPLLVTVTAGAAYNGQLFYELPDRSRRYQYFGQVIFNTLIGEKLGIGLVPSYVQNAHIYCPKVRHSFTLGNYLQYYVSPFWSLVVEWIPTVTGWRQYFNTFSFGIELETGGHFFKVFATNNRMLNTSQVLSGADLDYDNGDLRLGFMITRVLKF